MAGNTTQAGRTVTDKVAALLLVFTEGAEYNLTELARHADIPTSTTHRLIQELIHRQLLERTPDGRYRASDALRRMGRSDRSERESPVSPGQASDRISWVIRDLSRATGLRVRAGVLPNAGRVNYIETRAGHHAPAGEFAKMATLPAHPTALGRALLAFAPPGEVEKAVLHGFFPFTPNTVISAHRFRHALAITRATGLAITHGELEIGTCGIAMPVPVVAGHPRVAIELLMRECSDDPGRILPCLQIAVRSLARELAGVAGPCADIDGLSRPPTIAHQFATYQRERATHWISRCLPATHPQEKEQLCTAAHSL